MFDYLTRLIQRLIGAEDREPEPSVSSQRRRAPRAHVRVPVKTLILGTEMKMSGAQYLLSLNGYTKDISRIGVASILPGAHLEGLDLTGKHRRLKITLELKPRAVEIYATTVYCRQRLYVAKEDVGWLVGAHITKISHDNLDALINYLSTLDPAKFN